MARTKSTSRPASSGPVMFYGRKRKSRVGSRRKSAKSAVKPSIKPHKEKVAQSKGGTPIRSGLAANQNTSVAISPRLFDFPIHPLNSRPPPSPRPSFVGTSSGSHVSGDEYNQFSTWEALNESLGLESVGPMTRAKYLAISKYEATCLPLALLREVVEVFEHVPYVKGIAGTVVEILKVIDEVDAYKDRSVELTDKVMSYARVVLSALLDSSVRTLEQLADLQYDLQQIGGVLNDILSILQSFKSKGLWHQFCRVVNRNDILSHIEEQDRRLDTAITSFLLKSSISLRVQSTIGSNGSSASSFNSQSSTSTSLRSSLSRTRPKPLFVFGRDQEIAAIVESLLNPVPCRIAILGSGGIGKTTIALSAFHNDLIIAKYMENRIFISCESAFSPELILCELATALQIPTDSNADRLFSQILHQLKSAPYLLLLDNLETPWDSAQTRADTELLLSNLASLDNIGLIVTLRGSQYPSSVQWTQSIPPLGPVNLDSAKSIFYAISHKMDDKAVQLIQAVDCVPLAVTLLANLASSDEESTDTLWRRWNREHTSMLQNGFQDKSSSVDSSIRLSLSSARFRQDPEALPLLSMLPLLPDGLTSAMLNDLDDGIPGISNIGRSLSTLRQMALVYTDTTGSCRMLSPIRHFIASNHSPVHSIRTYLHDYCFGLIAKLDSSITNDLSAIYTRLGLEIGNIEALLVDCLEYGERLQEAVFAALDLCQFTYTSGLGSSSVVSCAVSQLEKTSADAPAHPRPCGGVASIPPPPKTSFRSRFCGLLDKEAKEDSYLLYLRAECLGAWGQLLSRQSNLKLAEEKFRLSLSLHEDLGDLSGKAYDLYNLGCLYSQRMSALSQAETMFREALKTHELADDVGGMAYDWMGLGDICLQRSAFEEAKELFKQALDAYVRLADERGQASALNKLGNAENCSSQFEEADKYFSAALDVYQRVGGGDVVNRAEALAGLALSHLLRCQFNQARSRIEEALNRAGRGNAPRPNPDHLHILGRVYIATYQYDRAYEILQQSLQLHLQNDDNLGHASDLQFLSYLASQSGRITEAQQQLTTSRQLYSEGGYLLGEADSLSFEGLLHLHLGDVEKAESCILRAMQLHFQVRCILGQAVDHYHLGCLRLSQGHLEEADSELRKALSLHTKCGNVQGQADDMNKICEVALLRCERDGLDETKDGGRRMNEILAGINQALVLHSQIGDVSGRGDDYYVQAKVLVQLGRLEDAEKVVQTAIELHGQAFNEVHKGRDLVLLASILKIWSNGEKSEPSVEATL